MTLLEAATILLKYGDGVYEHPNTQYGGHSNVYECTCCRSLLNVGGKKHADDCLLEEARKTIKEADEQDTRDMIEKKAETEFFSAVYDTLVSLGGAEPRMREQFIFHHTSADPVSEYRFGGHFGFGGKYWRKTNRVSYYQEDETPARMEALSVLNTCLVKLREYYDANKVKSEAL